MIENAAACRMCKNPSSKMNADRFCPACQEVLARAVAEGRHVDRLENFQPTPEMQDFLSKGEPYTLPCGCSLPPGCNCKETVAQATRIAITLMRATGLTLEGLEKLRTEYLQRGDFVGLTKKLDELAHLKGNVLLISRGE